MKNQDKNYTVAIIVSVLFHGLLLVALIWGSNFSEDKTPNAGSSIQAVVIDPSLVNQQAQKIRQQREEAKRAEDERLRRLEQQAEQLEKQRAAEEKRLRELKAQKLAAEKQAREAERERKRVAEEKRKVEAQHREAEKQERIAREKAAKAEAERKRQIEERKKAELAAKKAEEARVKKIAEQKAAEEAAKKAEAERQRKLAEQKAAEEAARKAEAERQRKIAEQKAAEEAAEKARKKAAEEKRRAAEAERKRKEQEAALNDLFSGLEDESAQRTTARGRQVDDAIQRQGAIFKDMIQQNWLIDSSMAGQTCTLKMRLSSNGLVLDVNQVSGNDSFCRAAKAAVLRVNSFPMPEDPDVVAKLQDIELEFEL